jgi:hypothetical protein
MTTSPDASGCTDHDRPDGEMMNAKTRQAILIDIAYARKQLTRHRDIRRALDALERIEVLCRLPTTTDSKTILEREA